MKQRPRRSVRALRAAAGSGPAACGGLESLESRRLLATFTVTNLDDAGAGSLRAAITEANNTAGADVIDFAQGLTGQITLTAGGLSISDDLAIDGPGAGDLSVSGKDLFRVLEVGAGVTASVSGLSITNGRAPIVAPNDSAGGGIRNAGTLTLTGVSITDSVARGFDYHIGGDGGGIFNSGTLTLTNSIVSGNEAQSGFNAAGLGGGIANTGTMTITNSAIFDNIAWEPGGPGLGHGGGVANLGDLTVINSTISGNGGGEDPWEGARGGAIYSNGALAISNSTLVGNAIDDLWIGGGTAIVTSSIISNLTGTLDPASGNNLIEVDALLLPLADNGGPTPTHAPRPASPAIGAGTNPLNLTTDQRGGLFQRSGNGAIDIGAYQTQTPPPSLVVSTLSDVIDGDYSQGNFSLREALNLANGTLAADTITFDPALGPATITLGGAELLIVGDVSIMGPGADLLTIDAAQTSRVVLVDDDVTATIDGLTLTGGLGTGDPTNSEAYGAGVLNRGALTLSNATVSGNSAPDGAGIRNFGALVLVNAVVSGNTASGNGGGIHSTGTLTLTGSTVSGNSAAGDGGGIFSESTLILTDSTVADNTASNGGGIFSSGAINMTTSTVSGNAAATDGGGIVATADATIADSTLAGNQAGRSGGGLYAEFFSETDVTGSTISGNSAALNGGGVANIGTLTMTNSTVSGNTAQERGGGLHTQTVMTVNNSTVTDNSAEILGGGVHASINATLRLRSTIVAGNAGFDVSGTVVAGSVNNLVQDATVALGLVNGVSGNILGVDPLLEPLADNGGPTLTHALPAGSPAIGAGANPLNLATDQRGQARKVGDRIDIGAFQRQSLDPTSIALFGGASLIAPLGHETRPQRANGTGFGPIEVDGESKSITYRITNDSGEVLVISLIDVRGQRPEDYSITGMPTLTLAPGESTDFTVTFNPTAFGARRANVAIFSNDPDRERFTLRIAGRGMPDDSLSDIAVTGDSIDIRDNDRKARPGTGQRFGGVEVGESVVLVFTVTNRGQGTLTFTSPIVRVFGANAGDFSVLSFPSGLTLAPDGTATFSIEFIPSAAGPRKATVEVLSDDPDESPFDFRIVGTGL